MLHQKGSRGRIFTPCLTIVLCSCIIIALISVFPGRKSSTSRTFPTVAVVSAQGPKSSNKWWSMYGGSADCGEYAAQGFCNRDLNDPNICGHSPLNCSWTQKIPSNAVRTTHTGNTGRWHSCDWPGVLTKICISNATYQCAANGDDILWECANEVVPSIAAESKNQSTCTWRWNRCYQDEVAQGFCSSRSNYKDCGGEVGDLAVKCCLTSLAICSDPDYMVRDPTGENVACRATTASGNAPQMALAGVCHNGTCDPGNVWGKEGNSDGPVPLMYFCRATTFTNTDLRQGACSSSRTSCPGGDWVMVGISEEGCARGQVRSHCRQLRHGTLRDNCIDIESNKSWTFCPNGYLLRSICAPTDGIGHTCQNGSSTMMQCCEYTQDFQGGVPCPTDFMYTVAGGSARLKNDHAPYGTDLMVPSGVFTKTKAVSDKAELHDVQYEYTDDSLYYAAKYQISAITGTELWKGYGYAARVPLGREDDPTVQRVVGSLEEVGLTDLSTQNGTGFWNERNMTLDWRGSQQHKVRLGVNGRDDFLFTLQGRYATVGPRFGPLSEGNKSIFWQSLYLGEVSTDLGVFKNTTTCNQPTYSPVEHCTDTEMPLMNTFLYRPSVPAYLFGGRYYIISSSFSQPRWFLGDGNSLGTQAYTPNTFRTEQRCGLIETMLLWEDTTMYYTQNAPPFGSGIYEMDLGKGTMKKLEITLDDTALTNPPPFFFQQIEFTSGIALYRSANVHEPLYMYATVADFIVRISMNNLSATLFAGTLDFYIGDDAFKDRVFRRQARMFQPTRLVVSRTHLFIADANNAAVRSMILSPCSEGFNASVRCLECDEGYYHYPRCRDRCTREDDCRRRAYSVEGSQPWSCTCDCFFWFAGQGCEVCHPRYDPQHGCQKCRSGFSGEWPSCRTLSETISVTPTEETVTNTVNLTRSLGADGVDVFTETRHGENGRKSVTYIKPFVTATHEETESLPAVPTRDPTPTNNVGGRFGNESKTYHAVGNESATFPPWLIPPTPTETIPETSSLTKSISPPPTSTISSQLHLHSITQTMTLKPKIPRTLTVTESFSAHVTPELPPPTLTRMITPPVPVTTPEPVEASSSEGEEKQSTTTTTTAPAATFVTNTEEHRPSQQETTTTTTLMPTIASTTSLPPSTMTMTTTTATQPPLDTLVTTPSSTPLPGGTLPPINASIDGEVYIAAVEEEGPLEQRSLNITIHDHAEFDPKVCQYQGVVKYDYKKSVGFNLDFLGSAEIWCDESYMTIIFPRSKTNVDRQIQAEVILDDALAPADNSTNPPPRTLSLGFLVHPYPPLSKAAEQLQEIGNTASIAVSAVGGGAAGEIQGMALMGMVSCADSRLKSSMKAARSVLSPWQIVDDEEIGYMLGNFAIVAIASVLVTIVQVGVYMKYQRDKQNGVKVKKEEYPDPTASKRDLQPWPRAAALVHWPGRYFNFIYLAHQGIAFEAFLRLHDPDRSTVGLLLGIVGLLYSLLAPGWMAHWHKTQFNPNYVKYKYLHLTVPKAVRIFTPSAFYLPLTFTKRFGTLFEGVNPKNMFFAVYDPLVKVNLVAFVASFQLDPGTPCKIQYGILAAIYAIEAIARIIRWPMRTLVSNVSPIAACITTCLLAINAGFQFALLSTEVAMISQSYLSIIAAVLNIIIKAVDRRIFQKREMKARHENKDFDFVKAEERESETDDSEDDGEEGGRRRRRGGKGRKKGKGGRKRKPSPESDSDAEANSDSTNDAPLLTMSRLRAKRGGTQQKSTKKGKLQLEASSSSSDNEGLGSEEMEEVASPLVKLKTKKNAKKATSRGEGSALEELLKLKKEIKDADEKEAKKVQKVQSSASPSKKRSDKGKSTSPSKKKKGKIGRKDDADFL